MRIDVVSIFPDYLAPLELSLAGRARQRGLLAVHVHDLREWTHDRHRTVDDTPYGGGAGMVMKPEPWGEALDAVLTPGATLVVPTPGGRAVHAGGRPRAGRPASTWSSPAAATRASTSGCADHYAATHDVRELSIGDYVLNGGEVAALVVVEAVARLLPGFMGNAESLLEESHEDGPARVPRLHQARPLARPRRAPGAAVGRPRGDRGLAPRPVPRPDGASDARTCCRPRPCRARRRSGTRSPPTPARS